MNSDLHAGHRAFDGRPVADVALDHFDRIPLGIVKGRDVERADPVPARAQIADQIDAEEARPAGDQPGALDHMNDRWATSRMPRTSSARPASCGVVTTSRRKRTETVTTMTIPPAIMTG